MTTDAGPEVQAAVSAAFTAEWGQVVATLIGVTGDWDLAEECAQDAFARALHHDSANRLIGAPQIKLRLQLQAHVVRQRIQRLGPVQGDEADGPALLKDDLSVVGH